MATIDINEINEISRLIHLSRLQEVKFLSNKISTSKYNVVTFFPKFIYEQFRRYSNVFFLLIVLLQQIPGVSPTGRFATMIPWLIILSVSAIKEVVEDIKRNVSDRQINNKKVNVLRDSDWVEIRWKELRVGDIVKISTGELFPADLFLISSSEPNSIAYIQTSNLDGETNLKIRQGLLATQKVLTIEDLRNLNASIECENPNQNLYKFTGTLILDGYTKIPIDSTQILLRGSQLKNTKWIFGAVIYTGHETKLMMNGNAPPFKRSLVEKATNTQIFLLFIILLVICIISTIASVVWQSWNDKRHWYLGILDTTSVIYTFITFIILYNNLIPISLQVTLELVKFLQAYFINSDEEMYDEENDFAAMARTSNLNEELGQVKYIFSDKTGTLTRNLMEFKRCSIGGICYGSGNHETFNSYQLMKNLNEHYENHYIDEFLSALATCHTVIPEKNDDNEIIYQASSPDEGSIMQFLQNINIIFHGRQPDKIQIRFFDQERTYEVLNVLEFTSVRKRVSVILRDENGKIKLYCKGADNVILPRLSQNQKFRDTTVQHLEEFAREGFRTLLVSYRDIDDREYFEWSKKYHKASVSIHNREEELQDVSELIETDMFLLGSTAIEDKLQIGVPETISMIQKAGIRLWVLTGDKIETAVNIGYSCKLLTETSSLIYIINDQREDIKETLKQNSFRSVSTDGNRKSEQLSLVIDAATLPVLLCNEFAEDFLHLALICTTVILCRATPKNKADVVELVKNKTNGITLAIGDGANDVGMIQAAHVGVGLYGREGSQALSASDYAIGQFRFLQRLLFVHGIWNYKRLCKVILYSFYKNVCLYVIELWFALANGFSGQILFERWLIGLYNVLFTAAPPMALGLFDRPLKAQTMLKYPQLYKNSQSESDFNIKVFWSWIFNAVLHSILLYYICYGQLKHDVAFGDGKVGDYLFLGNFVYTYCVIAVCLKSGLESDSWTYMTHLSIWGSIGFWFVFLLIYSEVWPAISVFNVKVAPEMSGMAVNVLKSPLFWFGLIFVPIFVLLPDVIYKSLQRSLFKNFEQAIQESEKANIDPDVLIKKHRFSETARLLKSVFSFSRTKPTTNYRGYAFSQEEHGAVTQSDLIRQYNTNVVKPHGN